MISSKTSLNIIVRVVLLVVTAIVFAFYIINSKYLIVIINLLLLIVFQAYFLIRYIRYRFKYFEQYFDSLEFNDELSTTFTKDKEFNRISKKLSSLNQNISDTLKDYKIKYDFLESMLNHMDIAVVCINNDGNMDIINNSAKKLFNMLSPGINERYIDKNQFVDDIKNIAVSEKLIYNLGPQFDHKKLLINAYRFKLGKEIKKIVTIQDIKEPLDTHENESWQKMSYYLSHEIMNSVSPIISTTKGINKLFNENKIVVSEHNKKEMRLIHDTMEGLDIIQERSEALQKFISEYRDLFEIKKITKTSFDLSNFIKKIVQSQNTDEIISFKVIPESLIIEADKVLLEQVLLNLIKNSIQATDHIASPKIEINAFVNTDEDIQIDVIDNGIGIPEEIFDKIFIPFYSTKKEGSGIGLSLSRYIMQLHHGYIKVLSIKGKTILSLIFN